MKNLILIFLMCFSLTAIAQRPDDRKERKERKKEMKSKIKALAIAHITKEIDLSSEEAQKFWPLYNEVKEERDRLEKEKRALITGLESAFDTMTEKEASKYVNELVALDQKIAATNLDYKHEDIIAVIGAKRFLQLKKAEVDFRRKILREYRGRRGRN